MSGLRLHELADIAVVGKVTSTATATSSCGRVCKSRRRSPASVGMGLCISLFRLHHLSNIVPTLFIPSPTVGGAEVKRCFVATYVDLRVEQTPLGDDYDLVVS